MNQQELNEVALTYLRRQSIEVVAKLQETVSTDSDERSKQVSGPPLLHIYNTALFECLAWLNAMFLNNEDIPEETLNEYRRFVDELRPKFQDIVEAFKDFQPKESD